MPIDYGLRTAKFKSYSFGRSPYQANGSFVVKSGEGRFFGIFCDTFQASGSISAFDTNSVTTGDGTIISNMNLQGGTMYSICSSSPISFGTGLLIYSSTGSFSVTVFYE